jgi:hypothetical protein
MPVNTGLIFRDTEWARITSAPENIPEHPTPATARPTIKILEFGAIPQINDPISKIPTNVNSSLNSNSENHSPIADRNVHFRE